MGLVIAYAQPRMEEPYLALKDLKKGKITPTKKSVWTSVLNFTDVGWAIWETAKAVDPKVKVKYNKISFFKRETTDTEQYQWDIEFVLEDFILTLKSRRYLSIKEDPSAFYLILELRGDDNAIGAFLTKMVEKLGADPTDFTDMEKLTKKVEQDAGTVMKTWAEFAGVTTDKAQPAQATPAKAQKGLSAADKKIIAKTGGAMKVLKKICENENTIAKFERTAEKKVERLLTKGAKKKAKANAAAIIKKITTMKKKFDSSMQALNTLHDKIRTIEDAGLDIMPSLNELIAAEKALKNADYTELKQHFNQAKKQITAQLKKLKEQPPKEKEEQPPAKEEKEEKPEMPAQLMSFDMAFEEDEGEEEGKRPDVEEIASFVVCKVCGETLGDRPIVQCSNCGKRYHEDCAKNLEKCMICEEPLPSPEAAGAEEKEEKKEAVEEAKEEEEEEDFSMDEFDMEGVLDEDIETEEEDASSIDDEFDAFLKEIDEL